MIEQNTRPTELTVERMVTRVIPQLTEENEEREWY